MRISRSDEVPMSKILLPLPAASLGTRPLLYRASITQSPGHGRQDFPCQEQGGEAKGANIRAAPRLCFWNMAACDRLPFLLCPS